MHQQACDEHLERKKRALQTYLYKIKSKLHWLYLDSLTPILLRECLVMSFNKANDCSAFIINSTKCSKRWPMGTQDIRPHTTVNMAKSKRIDVVDAIRWNCETEERSLLFILSFLGFFQTRSVSITPFQMPMFINILVPGSRFLAPPSRWHHARWKKTTSYDWSGTNL